MAQLERLAMRPLSFNINFSNDSSIDTSKSTDVEKLQLSKRHKMEMLVKQKEDFSTKPVNRKTATKEEFKIPLHQKLFIKYPASRKHARESTLPKFAIKNTKMPFSSTPKVCATNNGSAELNISPISNQTTYNNLNDVCGTSFDDLPSTKRLKTLKSAIETTNKKNIAMVSRNIGVRNENHPDEHDVSSTTSENDSYKRKARSSKACGSQNKDKQVTVRKTMTNQKDLSGNDMELIDMLDRHEIINSRNLTLEGIDPMKNNFGKKKHVSQIVSPDASRILPCHNIDKNLKQVKEAFDGALGVTASVISISSECISTSNAFEMAETNVTAKKEILKRSVCINTTKKNEQPVLINNKCTVGTQKNAVKDTSTNTSAPYEIEVKNNQIIEDTLIEKEASKKSIAINTSNTQQKLIPQSRLTLKKSKRSTTLNKTSNSSHNKITPKQAMSSTNTLPSSNITLESLRPRTRISYSSRTSTSNTKNDDTSSCQSKRNYTSNRQRKKRNTIIPTKLKKPAKSKPNKQEAKVERLSGFYEMDSQQKNNRESNYRNSNKRCSRRPTLFIQSHIVGAGPMKNVLLKKVTSKTSLEPTKTRSSKSNSSTKRASRKRKAQSSSADDCDEEVTFKKPLPVRKLRNASSSSAFDKEPLISSPIIETINEMPYDEPTETTISQDICQNNEFITEAIIEHQSTKYRGKRSITSTSTSMNQNNTSKNKSLKLKKRSSGNEPVSQDSGITTASLNPICIMQPLNNELLNTKQTTKPVKTLHSNSIQSTSKDSLADQQEASTSKVTNTNDTVVNKPRKSVTFCEPIELLPNANDSSDDEDEPPHTALRLSDRLNVQQPAVMDLVNDFDHSDSEGALCTILDNKPVILRNWKSEMPDLTSNTENSLVRYTLKNVPLLGGTISSGCFVLGPGQHKTKRLVLKHNILFHILHGTALVNVQGLKFTGRPGSHFVIPLGSIYSIANSAVDNQLIIFFMKFGPR